MNFTEEQRGKISKIFENDSQDYKKLSDAPYFVQFKTVKNSKEFRGVISAIVTVLLRHYTVEVIGVKNTVKFTEFWHNDRDFTKKDFRKSEQMIKKLSKLIQA